MAVTVDVVSRKGPYGLCDWHAERHCDGCGKIGTEILGVLSRAPSGRAFRFCRTCERKRMLAPALATPAAPKLVADTHAHPEYESGAARLGMALPAVCRIEGSARTEGSGTKKREHAANAWEVACPVVAPYDRLASVLDAKFSRRQRTLCLEMGEEIRSSTSAAPLRSEYAYWWIPASLLPLPHDAWWTRLESALPNTSAGTIAYDAPALPVEPAKPAKRSRRRAA
jgi:hypothetical protein